MAQISLTTFLLSSIVIYLVSILSGSSFLIFLLLIVIIYHHLIAKRPSEELSRIQIIDHLSSCPKPPINNVPKWLLFPEYEKARFLNHIISVLWNPHLKLALETKIRSKLEWKLEKLKKKFKKISRIEVNSLDLGTSPPLISGIKTCEVKCDLCARHIAHDQSKCAQKYCALEVEVIFVSDDILLSLLMAYKKLKATVTLSKVSFSGSLLVKLQDFVNLFPGFSSYSVSLLSYPKFDYSLSFQTGSLKVAHVPKVSKIIEPFLKKTIWTSFIYPKRKRFKIKTSKVSQLRKAGKLIKYGQISAESEGSLSVCLKEVVWDTPSCSKEVDYAVPQMIDSNDCYKDDMGYYWFCLVSIKGTDNVYKTKHLHSNYVMRRLKWNNSFAFKNITFGGLNSENISPFMDIDVRFLGKECDELMGQSSLDLRLLIEKNGYKIDNYKLDLIKFVNQNGFSFRKVGTVFLNIQYLPPNTLPHNTLRNVMMESIKDLNFSIVKQNLKKKALPTDVNAKPEKAKANRTESQTLKGSKWGKSKSNKSLKDKKEPSKKNSTNK